MRKAGLVLVLVVMAGLGCKLGERLSGDSGGGSGGSSSSSGGGDPTQAVIAASKKLVDLPFFSAKMDGTGANMTIKQQVDFAAPDRYHVKYEAGAAPGMEIITIGDQSWMKSNAGGSWTKMPGGPNASTPNLRSSFTDEGLKSLSGVQAAGEETLDGKSARVYTYKNVTPVGNYEFNSKMWVAADTGIPLQVVTDYTNGVLKQMTVKYDTTTPVSIEPPTK